MIDSLLQPGEIGRMRLNNRIIYSGITFKVGDNHGHLTRAEVDSMVFRAKQKYAPALITFPGLNDSMFEKIKAVNINTDEAMYVLKEQVDEVKINGIKAMAILGVLGTNTKENYCLGASDIKYPINIKHMSVEQIKEYIKRMGVLAKRSELAGFDAIRLQTGTPKKMLTYFISQYSNHRMDNYGGSLENRCRLVKEVLEEIRSVVGDKLAIILELRMKERWIEGITLDDSLKMFELLAPYIDAVEPSFGKYGVLLDGVGPYFTPYGEILNFAKEIKKINKNIKLIASGKMGNPELANSAISEGIIDYVAMARPLLADPEWITKMATGRENDVIKCIGCLNCFTEKRRSNIYPANHRACTVNPANLREKEFYKITQTENQKKILVIGGGLAGMEASITLAKRGHHVILCEKNEELGGQWIVASHSAEKNDYRSLLLNKRKQIFEQGIHVLTNTIVTKEFILSNDPDFVVLATGAFPRNFEKIPEKNLQVVQGNDIIMDKIKTGQNIVVVGGRYIGLECAAKLAKQGKTVSVVEMNNIGKDATPEIVQHYLKTLIDYHVCIYENCPVSRLLEGRVEIMHETGLMYLEADTVVLALGTIPNNDLVDEIGRINIPYCMIGDCKEIGDALDAIRDGAEIGRIL
ncbi:MAG: FAD-dependent oxidoreductase [Peptococcaceae bacterium]|nr:FAD-dependent oxidoreductase [Peptococcaceae bacterium]